MSWLSVAAYSLIGTLTRPNDTAPFQIARTRGSLGSNAVTDTY
jgi:hypothetical protein